MNIQVDNREKNNRIASCVDFFTDEIFIPDKKTYQGKGNKLTVSLLPKGDYIFDGKLCIEYKTAIDMIGSIMDGRVFSQAKKISAYPYSYIMIVGDMSQEIDLYNQNRRFRRNNKPKKPFTVNAYLGALARLSLMSKVVHVKNRHQGWLLMNSLASKMDTKKVYVDKGDKLDNPVASFLTCVKVNNTKRLSEKKALLIQEKLNLHSLSDLLKVTYDDLVNIKGIGSKTALKIVETL